MSLDVSAGLKKFGIRLNFPVELLSDALAVYPGEHARTEYIFDSSNKRKIVGIRIHFVESPSEVALYHELGHLKLRCMHLPVLGVPSDMPPWVRFFMILTDEFYVRLLIEDSLPRISEMHIKHELDQIPTLERLRIGAENIPPAGTREWYEGMIPIVQSVVNGIIYSKSRSIGDRITLLDTVYATFQGTSIQRCLDGIRSALLSLPHLPIGGSRFEARDQQQIVNGANRIMRIISNQSAPRFEPATFTIDC